MRKSIFRRYLIITTAIILLSFAMLGSVILLYFSQYWREERKAELAQNTAAIAEMAQGFLVDNGSLPQATMQKVLNAFSESVEADLIVVDKEGLILLAGRAQGGGFGEEAPNRVPEELVLAAVAGGYEGRSDLGGLYESNCYVTGAPINWGSQGPNAGAVFAAASAQGMSAFQRELFKIFLMGSAGALAVAVMLVGMFAYRQVWPLRQMSAAARSMGMGDFSVRVPVTSDDELGELAASFNSMANSLSLSEGTRRSFVANVSHELKTPMTTIAGFIDGILDGTIPREEQDRYLLIVSNEVKRLSRLVKSMLDLSRIDNGELKLSPVEFDMSETVVSTLLTFEQQIDERQIEVRGLEDIRPQAVYGDRDLLHQVVYNLFENAVKFTNVGGYIEVEVSGDDERCTVEIENSGAGIEPEEMPHIFERFYKTDKSRSLDKKGMGLGLYIVRSILKRHGGDITAVSAPGEFTRFSFFLPKLPGVSSHRGTGAGGRGSRGTA